MIPLIDLTAQYHSIQNEIDEAIHATLESGRFILGPSVNAFEEEISSYLGVANAVGVASGTDALVLSLRALDIGPGDDVLVPAFTFFATVGAVMSVGAKPVFLDIDPATFLLDIKQIEEKITSHTKAIIPVHLFGQPIDMGPIRVLARSHNFKIIEDNAQAFGAICNRKKTGTLGDIGCLSFFPTKNLGAYGDGGMVVTDNSAVADRVRMLRTHGWKKKYYTEELGYNSRLDALQAAILRVKLKHVDAWNQRRRELANNYNQELAPLHIGVPMERFWGRHVYHLYIIRLSQRDRLQTLLKEAGITSEVYYPLPPHLTMPCIRLGYKTGDFPEAEKACRETLALPLFPEMTEIQQKEVITAIKRFG
jgi:dTDP-4-amino-4,6-dideoxygalactose transaminase